jgi:hypothetical protein
MKALSTKPITADLRYTSTPEVAAIGAGPPRVLLSQEAAASLSINLLSFRRLRRIPDILPCQWPQLQPAVHEVARSNPTKFDASQML